MSVKLCVIAFGVFDGSLCIHLVPLSAPLVGSTSKEEEYSTKKQDVFSSFHFFLSSPNPQSVHSVTLSGFILELIIWGGKEGQCGNALPPLFLYMKIALVNGKSPKKF